MSINPFDGGSRSFFLVNDVEQRGLRPTSAYVPGGWRAVRGEAHRAACLDNIEQNWADIESKSLRDRLAAGRAY